MAINKNKVMDAGRKAYEKGQYDKALREYLKVVKEDPKDVRVWLKIGDLYTKKQANAEATETYMKVAKFYSDQGFFKKSVAVYKQILRVDPRLVEVNLKLAELYRQLGLLSDAMQHFEMVAAFFHREGKTREALATLRQLVELDPENVATRIKLAEVYSKEQMAEEAIREFTITCDFLRKNGRQEDFLKVAERLLFHDPENLELCKELATLYLQRNDARRALAKLQICFKADQSDPSVLALLAQAFQRLDQKGKTVSVLKELARVHMDAGRKHEAAEVHEKILQYIPDEPASLAFLGRSASEAIAEAEPQVPAQAEYSDPVPMVAAEPVIHQDVAIHENTPYRASTDEAELLDSSLLDSDVEEGVDEFPQEDSFVADLELIEEESIYETENSSVETQESADEIVKILTETDVYVKYGLNQKAVDHLRKVFELDERNIEARERLQDILIKEGRQDEGIRELMILAEHSLTRPEIARGYLMQILALDNANPIAHDFAARYQIRLDVPSTEPVSGGYDAVGDFSGGTSDLVGHGLAIVEENDLDFDDLAFDEMPMGGEMHDQQSVQLGNPNPTVTRRAEGYDYEQPEEYSPESTAEVDANQVEAALHLGDDLDFDLAPPGDPFLGDELAFDAEAAAAFDADAGFSSPATPPVEDLDVFNDDELLELDSSELIMEERGANIEILTDVESLQNQSPSNLEDDLDEADFFLSQSLFSEALEIVDPLMERFPNNPLVLAKQEEIAAAVLAAGKTSQSVEQTVGDENPFAGDFDDELLNALDEDGPSVVLEHPVDDNDADTHFDLGLAYKEMGLLNEAIAAFEKVLQLPGKAVQGRIMAGLCYRELGSLSEAISQFKAGLYENQISNSEKYSLYYEIGLSYEQLQDPQEAMYYYEMVLKKDPEYRDVADRVAAIKG